MWLVRLLMWTQNGYVGVVSIFKGALFKSNVRKKWITGRLWSPGARFGTDGGGRRTGQHHSET